jgi:hypothetical protein
MFGAPGAGAGVAEEEEWGLDLEEGGWDEVLAGAEAARAGAAGPGAGSDAASVSGASLGWGGESLSVSLSSGTGVELADTQVPPAGGASQVELPVARRGAAAGGAAEVGARTAFFFELCGRALDAAGPAAGGAGRGPWVTLVEVVEAARGAGGARAADVGVSLVQLLALAARGAVAVQQRGPYQDIRIARGPAWASFAAAHGAPAGAEGAAGPGTPGAGPGSAPMTPAGAAGRGRRAATEQKARVAGRGRKRKAESDVEASDSEGVMV